MKIPKKIMKQVLNAISESCYDTYMTNPDLKDRIESNTPIEDWHEHEIATFDAINEFNCIVENKISKILTLK